MEDYKLKYRVEEKNGLFYIQILGYGEREYIFFGKRKREWVYVNRNGGVCNDLTYMLITIALDIPLPPFKSLSEAKDKIKEFTENYNKIKEEPKYHFFDIAAEAKQAIDKYEKQELTNPFKDV